MTKKRVKVPKAVHERVMREYRHLCAICGEAGPQLHHIDEDPSNNDPKNLLPLCPNHHLRDQHDPTANLDPGRLTLFRKYKDPTILTSEFEPLYRRFRYLDELKSTESSDDLCHRASDLIAFVRVLEMGDYYAGRLKELIGEPDRPPLWEDDDRRIKKLQDEWTDEYVDKLRAARQEAEGIVVELLRYQGWTLEKESVYSQGSSSVPRRSP